MPAHEIVILEGLTGGNIVTMVAAFKLGGFRYGRRNVRAAQDGPNHLLDPLSSAWGSVALVARPRNERREGSFQGMEKSLRREFS